jgi:hypothetical protein
MSWITEPMKPSSRGETSHVFNGVKPTESTFRGTWQPVLYKPTFNAFSFLPTPPPQQPRKKIEKGEDNTHPPPPPPVPTTTTEKEPEPKQEEQEPQELLTEPPIPPDQVLFSIIDREKNYRSCIAKDGTVTNNRGQIIGYINVVDKQAGSANEEYLGTVLEDRSFNNVYQVRDALDELCGTLDMGTATIRDAAGGTVADFQSNGVVKHSNGTYLGQFLKMKDFHHMIEMCLYLMLIDPGMCSDVAG